MGLYKRKKSAYWWMSFTNGGKLERVSTNVTDKKTAQRIYDKVRGQLAEGMWFEKLPGESKTLSDLLAKYIKEYAKANKCHSSYIRDGYTSKRLLGYFGDIVLTKITPKSVSQYKQKRREDGMAAATINRELSLLGHAINISIKEWEWLRDNPVSRVSKEKVNNKVGRWLSFEEEEALLKESPQWLREIISFAILTGLRRGEILSLRWDRVDLFKKVIYIFEQKNKGHDTLPLESALDILKERAKVRSIKTNLVFYSAVGTKISGNNVRRAFMMACERAGIKGVTFHTLRHTFATRLVEAGVDIFIVQKLGRWKDMKMVMRYAHHQPKKLREGIAKMEVTRTSHFTLSSHSSLEVDNSNS